MFLKATNRILKEDNTTTMRTVLVEMESATEDMPQEEKTAIYYRALRKALKILSNDWKDILMWGANEVVDAKLSKDSEYNLMVKSTTQGMDVEADDIFLL